MSLKQELVQWSEACRAYEMGDPEGALELFEPIADSSKIHFNIGMIMQSMQDHPSAIDSFSASVNCDNYLSVAYFQKGVSHFQIGEFEMALDSFEIAIKHMRQNPDIKYDQLGLEYTLFRCEVLYNRALALFQVGDDQAAMRDLGEASKLKTLDEHVQIDAAAQAYGDGFGPFQVPVDKLYKPPAAKIQNANKVDYLGRSKVVAAVDASDNFTEFKGARGMQREPEPEFKPIVGRPRQQSDPAPMMMRGSGGMSGASTLGRSRQGSEPPPPMLRVDTMSRGRRPTLPSVGGPRSAGPGPRSAGLPMRSPGGSMDSPGGGYGTVGRNGGMRSAGPGRRPSGGAGDGYPPTLRDRGGDDASEFSTSRGSMSSNKLRVKVNFLDLRPKMIQLSEDATFDELVIKIEQKFNEGGFSILFMDEDGEGVPMTEDDDLLLARSLAPDYNKIEVWCQ